MFSLRICSPLISRCIPRIVATRSANLSGFVYKNVPSIYNVGPKNGRKYLLQSLIVGVNRLSIRGITNRDDDLPPREYLPKTIKYQIPRIYYGSKNFLRIKKHQMKVHQRKKWRKRFASYIRQLKLRRNIKKEKNFRAEILGKIREAENFDPDDYVRNVFSTIDSAPEKEQHDEAHLIKAFKLIAKYRSDTHLTSPYFDDPVPKKYTNVFKAK